MVQAHPSVVRSIAVIVLGLVGLVLACRKSTRWRLDVLIMRRPWLRSRPTVLGWAAYVWLCLLCAWGLDVVVFWFIMAIPAFVWFSRAHVKARAEIYSSWTAEIRRQDVERRRYRDAVRRHRRDPGFPVPRHPGASNRWPMLVPIAVLVYFEIKWLGTYYRLRHSGGRADVWEAPLIAGALVTFALIALYAVGEWVGYAHASSDDCPAEGGINKPSQAAHSERDSGEGGIRTWSRLGVAEEERPVARSSRGAPQESRRCGEWPYRPEDPEGEDPYGLSERATGDE